MHEKHANRIIFYKYRHGYHNRLLEHLLVVLLRVDLSEVSQEMTWIHAVQAVEQAVHRNVQMQQIDVRNVHWSKAKYFYFF